MSSTSPSEADARLARVDQIVTAAMAELPPGAAIDVDALVAAHPELERELRAAALGLSSLQRSTEQLAAPAVPERIGPYRIRREVGRGGMGVVYEAEDASLDRLIALKVLPRSISMQPGYVERFQREALAAARLEHSNVVPVYGVDETDGQHYIVMKLVDGVALDHLSDHLRAVSGSEPTPAGPKGTADSDVVDLLMSGRIEPAEDEQESGSADSGGERDGEAVRAGRAYHRNVARIARSVARALEYAHGRGVLHRDVKPGNVLIDRTGHVWVTDFGLAKIGEDDDLTGVGGFVGTLRYTSPEQFHGRAEPRSDVYSLGLVLYELLAMQRAIGGEERAEILHEVLYGTPENPRALRAGVPEDLAHIAMKAIAKLPEQRYPDARSMGEDLTAFLEGRPVAARIPSALYVTRLALHRNRALVGAVVLAFLCLGVMAAVYVAQLQRSADSESILAYRGQVAAAAAAVQIGNVPLVDAHLERCPPDRRGWEWHHLRASGDQSLGTVLKAGHPVRSLRFVDGAMHVQHVRGVTVLRDGAIERVAFPSGRTDRGDTAFAASFQGGWLGLSFYSGLIVCPREGVPEGAHIGAGAEGVEGFELIGLDAAVTVAAISDDEQRLVLVQEDGAIRVVDTSSFTVVRERPTQVRSVTGVAMRPDGAFCWTVSEEGSCYEWNLDTLERRELEIPRCQSYAIAYSTATNRLAIGREDHQLALYDLGDDSLRFLRGHAASITAIGFSDDGQQLASASLDQEIRTWNLEAEGPSQSLTGLAGRCRTILWHPSGQSFFTGGIAGVVQEWVPGIGGGRAVAFAHGADIAGAAFSSDGTRVATGGRDGTIQVRDALTLGLERVFVGHGAELSGVQFHAGDRRVVGCDYGGFARSFDVDTGAERWCAEPGGVLAPPAFLGSGADERIVLVSRSGRIEVRDAGDGSLAAASEIEDTVLASVCTLDGQIVAGTNGGDVLVLDPESLAVRSRTAVHDDAILGLKRGVRPGEVWTGALDGVVTVFDVRAAKTRMQLRAGAIGRSSDTDGLEDVTVSRDGTRVAVASRGSFVRLMDADDGESLLELTGHRRWVRTVSFSPDGSKLLSTDSSTQVRIWDSVDARTRAQAAAERRELEEAARAQWAAWLGGPIVDPRDVDRALAELDRRTIHSEPFENALRSVVFQARAAELPRTIERRVLASASLRDSTVGGQFVRGMTRRSADSYGIVRVDAVTRWVRNEPEACDALLERLAILDAERTANDLVARALRARLAGELAPDLPLAAGDPVDAETARRILARDPIPRPAPDPAAGSEDE